MSDTVEIKLYDYWRSSASYRVRIALGLLGLPYSAVSVDLLKQDHKSDVHKARNPQGLLPAMEIDGARFGQSLAILEYLHETQEGSRLLPEAAQDKHLVRWLSYAIAMEIHPVCNLGVVKHVMDITGDGDKARSDWMQKFIGEGLEAFEALLQAHPAGTYCFGAHPTMADCCLIPQLYNAQRWGVEYGHLKRIRVVEKACRALPAFAAAHPDVIGAP